MKKLRILFVFQILVNLGLAQDTYESIESMEDVILHIEGMAGDGSLIPVLGEIKIAP